MAVTGTWGECLSQGQAEGIPYPLENDWGWKAASSESLALVGGILLRTDSLKVPRLLHPPVAAQTPC